MTVSTASSAVPPSAKICSPARGFLEARPTPLVDFAIARVDESTRATMDDQRPTRFVLRLTNAQREQPEPQQERRARETEGKDVRQP
ncbi:MAG: hypothetical protein R3B96_10110 [Pirellulaceae bacterium]